MRATILDRLTEARDDPQDLGFGEICELGRDALNEIERLRDALDRIQTPLAFYLPTAHVDPEAYARMVYAQAVLEGASLSDAGDMAQSATVSLYSSERLI